MTCRKHLGSAEKLFFRYSENSVDPASPEWFVVPTLCTREVNDGMVRFQGSRRSVQGGVLKDFYGNRRRNFHEDVNTKWG